MSESLVSNSKKRVNPVSLTCPRCKNGINNFITDFGSKGLCSVCRYTWNILDKFMTKKNYILP